MQVKKMEANRIFKKLDIVEKTSTHHISGWVVVDGKKTLLVHYSHGKGDMPGRVGDKFRKSFLLSVEEFIEFKRCTMSKIEYLSLIKTRV